MDSIALVSLTQSLVASLRSARQFFLILVKTLMALIFFNKNEMHLLLSVKKKQILVQMSVIGTNERVKESHENIRVQILG